MQDDETRRKGVDELSSLSWADYLAQNDPDLVASRRRSFVPQSRKYTAVMLAILLLLAIYGVVSGNAAGVVVAVVLVVFVFLPFGIVLALERRRLLSDEAGPSASDVDQLHS